MIRDAVRMPVPPSPVLSKLWPEVSRAIVPVLPTAAYTLRTMLAIGLALWSAFFLQLQAPISAATTVLIVANPMTGALVSKSLWRLSGTLVGAVAAVVLMAVFAQSPLLFTIALSVCIGLACFVSTLLRYFRAYAAVLAGYTIIIVANGSFENPTGIFLGALSRLSAVSLGVVSAALVFMLTGVPRPNRLSRSIETLVHDIAESFVLRRQTLFGPALPPPADRRRAALLPRAFGLDEEIEYAAADSYDVRRRTNGLRLGAARLLDVLSALEPLHEGAPGETAGASDRALAIEAQLIARSAIEELSQMPRGGLAGCLPALRAARERVACIGAEVEHPSALTTVLHERDLLDQFIESLVNLTSARLAVRPIRLVPFLEWSTASRNAIRGLLVTLLGGLFWYVTRWTNGPTLLSFLIPAACLLSTAPSAARASIQFATGTMLALVGALLCQIFLLPRINGFPLLWLSLCFGLAPGIWFQHHPRFRFQAFAYCVFFNTMIRVQNPINFDDLALFNAFLGFIVGSIALVLVFRVLLPAQPRREVRRLAASLGRGVEVLALPWPRSTLGRLLRSRPVWEIWENQQMQKIMRLLQRLREVPGIEAAQIEQSAFVVVALGRIVLWLQRLALGGRLPQSAEPAAATALALLRRVRRAPGDVAMRLDALAATLQDAPCGEQETPDLRLLVGAIGEAALLVRRAEPFLDRRFPMLAPC